jgi:DNA-directed RNA polymerase subunit omega
MARITVEDCIDKFESRFELVLVASNRARKLHSGESPTVEKDNDKPTVIALREIADETVTIDSLKEKLIQEYQTVSPLDEEELSLDYTGTENVVKDEIIAEDDHQLNQGNDEISSLNEDVLDSEETPINVEYDDISDVNNS